MELIIQEYNDILAHDSPKDYFNSYLEICSVKLWFFSLDKKKKDGLWHWIYHSKQDYILPCPNLSPNVVAFKICRWVRWVTNLYFSAFDLFELAESNWKALYRGRQTHLKSCWLCVGGRPTAAGSGSSLWKARRAETLNFSKHVGLPSKSHNLELSKIVTWMWW